MKSRAGGSPQARRCRLIVRRTPEKIHSKTDVAHPVPEPGADAAAMGPREDDGRDAGVEVDRQGGRHADERQAQVFGHGPARHLDLVDDEGIDALIADRGRGVPEEHHRLPSDSAKHGPQGGEALELTELLIPRAEGAGGKSSRPIWRNSQARRPDRLLEVGDLEVDHFMAPRLEPPPQGRERIEVTRRGETQDADTTHGSSSLVTFVLVPFIFDSGTRPCDRDCVGLNRMILTWKFDLLCFHVLGFCFFVRFRHKR